MFIRILDLGGFGGSFLDFLMMETAFLLGMSLSEASMAQSNTLGWAKYAFLWMTVFCVSTGILTVSIICRNKLLGSAVKQLCDLI